jgi:hypothetical protein
LQRDDRRVRLDMQFEYRLSRVGFVQCLQELMHMSVEPSKDDKRHLFNRTVEDALSRTVATFINNATIEDADYIVKHLCYWKIGRPLKQHTLLELRTFFLSACQHLCEAAKFHYNFLRWTRTYFYPIMNAFIANSKRNKLRKELQQQKLKCKQAPIVQQQGPASDYSQHHEIVLEISGESSQQLVDICMISDSSQS